MATRNCFVTQPIVVAVTLVSDPHCCNLKNQTTVLHTVLSGRVKWKCILDPMNKRFTVAQHAVGDLSKVYYLLFGSNKIDRRHNPRFVDGRSPTMHPNTPSHSRPFTLQ